MTYRAAVITASNRASSGVYPDLSGEVLRAGLTDLGYECAPIVIVRDDIALIQQQLGEALAAGVDLIITTGGTGVTPLDLTPEATRPFIERELPGLQEAFRAMSRVNVPTADLSRGLAGLHGKTLIINAPGSPGAVRDMLKIVAALALHIHEQVAGGDH
jgi:molybdenum cofactor synthesis domain-containing protein